MGRIRPTTRQAIAAAAAALALAGCGSGASSSSSGRALFVREGCGSCHTLRTAGAHGGVGPNFDTSERLTLRQIRRALDEGANGMPSYTRLGRQRLDAIAHFLYAATH